MVDSSVLIIIGGTAAGVTFTMKVVDYVVAQVLSRRNGHGVEITTRVAVLEEHVNGIDAAVVVAVKNVETKISDFKDQHSRDLNDIKIRLGRIEAKTP